MIAPRRHPAHVRAMTSRATKRPEGFAKPAHWSDTPPPKPGAAQSDGEDEDAELSPTRYGDWVKNGIAIDF